MSLTVRLLVTSAGTRSTELLGFASTGISDKKCAIILNQYFLNLSLRCFIDEFLIVSYNSLSYRLTDSIYLRRRSSTLDADSDIDL